MFSQMAIAVIYEVGTAAIGVAGELLRTILLINPLALIQILDYPLSGWSTSV